MSVYPHKSKSQEKSKKPSFAIPITNEVLKHRHKIGSSIWFLLWCIDRVTKHRDGQGLVLGGKPLTDEEIGEELKLHYKTIARDRRKVTRLGYIKVKRTPRGNVLFVVDSMKWSRKRRSEIAPSQMEQKHSIAGAKTLHRGSNFAPSNIDSTKDSTRDMRTVQKLGSSKKSDPSPTQPKNGAHSTSSEKLLRQIVQGQKQAWNGIRAHLLTGIHRERWFKAYDDWQIELSRGGKLTAPEFGREMLHEASKLLLENRGFKELNGVGEEQLAAKAWPRLKPRLPSILSLRDYEKRKHVLGGVIFNLVVDAALELKPKEDRSLPEMATSAA